MCCVGRVKHLVRVVADLAGDGVVDACMESYNSADEVFGGRN